MSLLSTQNPSQGTGVLSSLPLKGQPRAPADILHLAELVPVVRTRFDLAETFPDDAILASLKTIAGQSEARERWRVAFASNLGVALSRQGRDLNTALNTLLALLPRPTS